MKVIFERNKINNQYIYDFVRFEGNTDFIKEIQGHIFAGMLDKSEIDMSEQPVRLVNENTAIGFFVRANEVDAKFKSLSKYKNEHIEIEIQDGIDYTSEYNRMIQELELLQLEINDITDSKKIHELTLERENLKKQCDELLESSVYEELNFNEYFEDINDLLFEDNKKMIKGIGLTAGILTILGLGITLLRKFKK